MSTYVFVYEIMEDIEISKNEAYKLIRKLNSELEAMGYHVFRGRVNREYYYKRTRYQAS